MNPSTLCWPGDRGFHRLQCFLDLFEILFLVSTTVQYHSGICMPFVSLMILSFDVWFFLLQWTFSKTWGLWQRSDVFDPFHVRSIGTFKLRRGAIIDYRGGETWSGFVENHTFSQGFELKGKQKFVYVIDVFSLNFQISKVGSFMFLLTFMYVYIYIHYIWFFTE